MRNELKIEQNQAPVSFVLCKYFFLLLIRQRMEGKKACKGKWKCELKRFTGEVNINAYSRLTLATMHVGKTFFFINKSNLPYA